MINLLLDVGENSRKLHPSGAGRVHDPIVLVGDYHFGDIKYAKSGPSGYTYAESLGISDRVSSNSGILQVMSSGMSYEACESTTSCHSYYTDYSGMRKSAGQEPCSIVIGPNFGSVQYRKEKQKIYIAIHTGKPHVDGEIVKSRVVLDMSNGGQILHDETITFDIED